MNIYFQTVHYKVNEQIIYIIYQLYIYVCVCVCIYIYIYIYVCMCIYTHATIYNNIYII